MFKYKLLKYTLVVVSIIAFAVPLFSDYVRHRTLERYDLRWTQTLDRQSRTQTIVVRNASSQAKENLVLELDPGPNAARVFQDFEISSSERGPFQTFLDTVELTNVESAQTGLTAPEKNKILQELDAHSSQRGLDNLDGVFDEILRNRLPAGTDKRTDVPFSGQRTVDWHVSWKQKCSAAKSTAECPKIDAVLVDWEAAKAVFQNTALDRWHNETGVGFASTSDQLSLDKKLFVTLSLGANELRVLRFRYTHSPATVSTLFRSTSGERPVQLGSVRALFSPFLFVLFTKHPNYLLTLLFLCLVVTYWYGPALLPMRVVSIEKIFNFALESKDFEYWQQALEQHRFYILQEFRRLRRTLNPNLAVASDDQVIDFVREQLMRRYERTKVRFRSTRALNTSIHDELWCLVQTAL